MDYPEALGLPLFQITHIQIPIVFECHLVSTCSFSFLELIPLYSPPPSFLSHLVPFISMLPAPPRSKLT
jgi:hypothetical protein